MSRSIFVSCLLLSSAGGVAEGQAVAASASTQADDDVAHGLFEAGKSAYEAGNFKEALQFFEQAYQHSPRPGFLFNIGQTADRLRQDDKALASFQQYLDEVPEADNRVAVQQRVNALEDAKQQRAAAAAPAAPPSAASTASTATTPTAAGTPTAAPSPAVVATQANASATHGDSALTSDASSDGAAARKPITKQWWFWTGLGAAVVGGTAVALAVALSGGSGGQAPLFQGTAGAIHAH